MQRYQLMVTTDEDVAEGSNAPCMDVTGQQRSEMLHA